MGIIKTLATSTYRGGQRRIDFRARIMQENVISKENMTAEAKKIWKL